MKQSIHITDVNSFLSCRRAWNWSSNLRQHLTTIEPYEPFYFGTLVHQCLEWQYDPSPASFQRDPITKMRANGVAVEFVDFIEKLYDHYITWQHHDKSALSDKTWDWLAVEKPFSVPVYTPRGTPSSKFRFDGKVDGVMRSRVDGKLYLHEIKTTTSIDSRIKQLVFEFQPTAYMLAMQEVYQETIAGVVYTLIRKKLPQDPDVLKSGMLSKNKGIDTTAERYLAVAREHHNDWSDTQIRQEYGDVITTLLSQPNRFFRRVLVTRTDAELNQMQRILYDVARDMTNKNIPLYPNPGYFCGNCQFNTPCMLLNQGQSIDTVLSTHYTRNTRLD